MTEGVFNLIKNAERVIGLTSRTTMLVTLNAIHMSSDQRIETDLHLQSVKTEE